MATAKPSVASKYLGLVFIFSIFINIDDTCSLEDFPDPVTDSLIFLGA